jgi:rod shape-determining protein MreC
VAPTLAARVVAGNPVPGVLTITIDRGTADGVRANMAVINGQGVIGRVIDALSAHAATVQLLADRAANAGATLEASGMPGNISGGHGDGQFRLELIPTTTDVAVGERVVTSGQDGVYPKGFLIGTVSRVTGTGKAREIVVAPAADFQRIDIVLVLLTPPAATADKQRP